MPIIARLGDPGSHGGSIITAASRTLAEGVPIARVGDIYGCAIHGANPIMLGASRTYAEGPLIAFNGSVCACGASIIATATRTFVE